MVKKEGTLGDINITSKEMQAALKAQADGGASYIGLNDEMLNLGDAESFIDEADAGKEFTIRMTNNTGSTQRVQFNKVLGVLQDSHAELKEGHVVTAGTSGSEVYLDANGDPRSIDLLMALIKETPIRVRSIKFNVSDASQLDEPIKYLVDTPFKTPSIEQKIPSTYQDQNTNNTKTVEVSFKNWILGFDSTILYSIRNGVSVSMTLCLGASLDGAHALREKFNAAVKTAATYYARQNS